MRSPKNSKIRNVNADFFMKLIESFLIAAIVNHFML